MAYDNLSISTPMSKKHSTTHKSRSIVYNKVKEENFINNDHIHELSMITDNSSLKLPSLASKSSVFSTTTGKLIIVFIFLY